MKRSPLQQEVVELIEFYEARGWDWTTAVEFTLVKASGNYDAIVHPKTKFQLMDVGRPRKAKTE